MDSPAAAAQRLLCLNTLCRREDSQEEWATEETVLEAVDSMQDHPEDAEVQRAACTLFVTLSKIDDLKIAPLGALEALVSALDNHAGEHELQRDAMLAMCCIVEQDRDDPLALTATCARLGDCGFCKLLIAAMKILEFSCPVQTLAMRIIARLCTHSSNIQRLLDAQAVTVIVAASEARPREDTWQIARAEAMSALASDKSAAAALGATCAPELITDALRLAFDRPRPASACMAAISALAQEGAANCSALIRADQAARQGHEGARRPPRSAVRGSPCPHKPRGRCPRQGRPAPRATGGSTRSPDRRPHRPQP